MKILNAKICSNGQIFDGEVTVDGERIASVTPKETSSSSDETIIDAKGMYVIQAFSMFISMVVWDMIPVMPQRKRLIK